MPRGPTSLRVGTSVPRSLTLLARRAGSFSFHPLLGLAHDAFKQFKNSVPLLSLR